MNQEAISHRVRFHLLRHHARGGLGQVSVALDKELNREVAYKEIVPERADDAANRLRFVREGEITGSLEHPGVVPIYSLGSDTDGRPYYAMRFIRGQTLQAAIAELHDEKGGTATTPRPSRIENGFSIASTVDYRESTSETQDEPTSGAGDSPSNSPTIRRRPSRIPHHELAFRQLLQRFVQVCNTVEYAHSRGVIHRDIKPANVMLGPFNETLLVDWGLAKMIGDSRPNEPGRSLVPYARAVPDTSLATQAGTVAGTLAYMSPEQAHGDVSMIGRATDVYSLGATFYTMLTGLPPFATAPTVKLLADVREGRFESPRRRCPGAGVPKALESICLKAMATNPDQRYSSPLALANDIEHWLADERVSAHMETPMARMSRLARKHRGIMRAISFAAIIVLAISIGAAFRENRLRVEAEANYNSAKEAVNKYVETVQNAKLLQEERFKPLLKELLKDAITFYDGLIEVNSNRPDRIPQLAKAVAVAASVSGAVGDVVESQKGYSRAIELYEQLCRDFPQDIDYRRELASHCDRLSHLFADAADYASAMQYLQRALSIRETLAREHPDEPGQLASVADSINNLGALQSIMVDYAAALESHERALSIRERLADLNPQDQQLQSRLAQSLFNVGVVSRNRGDVERARQTWEQSLRIQQKVAEGTSKTTDDLRTLASYYLTLGRFRNETGDSTGALDYLGRATAILDSLAKTNPNYTQYQVDLAGSLEALARANQGIDTPAVIENHRKALTIRRSLAEANPTVPEYQVNVASSLAIIGAYQKSVADLEGAKASLAEAVEILESVASRHSEIASIQSTLAERLLEVGNQWLAMGDSGAANSRYLRAQEISERLLARFPDNEFYLTILGKLYNNLGVIHSQHYDLTGARTFHEQAIAIREKAVKRRPQILNSHYLLAGSYSNLGNLLRELNDQAGAKQRYEQAIEIKKKLADAQPAVRGYQHELAVGHLNLARLQLDQVGEQTQAESNLLAAKAIFERLVESEPGMVEYQRNLAGTLNSLGQLQSSLSQFDAARASFSRAIGIEQNQVRVAPASADAKMELAHTFLSLAQTQCRGLEWHDAVASFQQAVEIYENLRASQPDSVVFQNLLAKSLLGMAGPLNETRDYDSSTVSLERAVAIQTQLIDRSPNVPEYHDNLANSLVMIGVTQLKRGAPVAAKDSFMRASPHHRRAMELMPANGLFRDGYWTNRVNLSVACLSLNEPKEAAEAAQEAADIARGPSAMVTAARQLGRCLTRINPPDGVVSEADRELGERYSQKIATLVKRALEAGYRDPASIVSDPAFSSVANRADFRSLFEPTAE